MTKNKWKKWTSIAVLSGMIVGATTNDWNVQASYSASDYYNRMIANFEYDQNNFKEGISGKIMNPDSYNNENLFSTGVKYNAYQPQGNTGSVMTIKEMKADKDSAMTTSFWVKFEPNSNKVIPFAIGQYTLYQYGGRFGFNTFNHDIYGVDFEPNGSWTHVIATFHKDDFTKNTLYLNGKKQTLKNSGSPLNSTPLLKNATWDDNTRVTFGGLPSYTLKGDSMIDEFQLLRGTVTDEDVTNLYSFSRVPELNGFQDNNKAKLEWSVSTFNPNPFYKTSFEAGEEMAYESRDTFDTIDFIDGDAYNGSQKLVFNHTTDLRGNGWFYPSTKSDRSYVYFGTRKFVPNGTPLSVSLKARATANSTIEPQGVGGVASSTIDFHKIYGGAPKVILEDAPKGSTWIKVSNITEIPNRAGIWVADRYIPEPKHEGPYYSYAEIKEIDIANSKIRLSKGLQEDFKAGQVLQGHRHVSPIRFTPQTIIGDGEWKNINLNTTVQNVDYYDTMIRGFALYLFAQTEKQLEIDDVELVEAAKVELFRDEELIYSGYNSQYIDNQAIDRESPSKPAVKRVELDDKVANVTLSKPKDNGSLYHYKSRSVTSDGTQTVFSDVSDVTVVSGIKGYSYVVDSNPETTPNGSINSTDDSISLAVSQGSATQYLHVRAIDNQGNAGEALHIKLTLPKLLANPSQDGTYADLNWSFDMQTEPFEYKVYKREKGNPDFQSVSTFNEATGKQLKTLLVYPTLSCGKQEIPSESFIDSTGSQRTLPKSASLESWMESPNNENPKGFGKGLIEVDSVSGNEFNIKHATLLKDSQGNYKYDSIVFGIWDCHGQDTLSDEAYNSLVPFIEDGRGVLLGHDSVFSDARRKNYLAIGKEYGNIDMMEKGYSKQFRSTDIEIVRDGILTRYPWNLGGVGTKLSVPLTHTSYQKFTGDAWMRWTQPPLAGQNQEEYEQTNVFLHSWNNIAMIQTGHSNGQATVDEQKILANVLFYLSQKTSETSLKDFSSVDNSKPDVVLNPKFTRNKNGTYSASFLPVRDNGTSYEYYVEAVGKVTGSTYRSPVKEATILSGVKGYDVEVNHLSVPLNGYIQKVDSPITFTVPDSTLPESEAFYIHVKALDGAGNQSVHTSKYESSTAYLVITPSTFDWTNKPVTLTIRGSQGMGAIQSLRLPDGTIIQDSSATIIVQENGYYPFWGKDEFGQWMSGGFTVSNIDMGNPEINMPNIPSNWADKDVEININAN